MKWYDIAKTRIEALGLNQEKLAEHLGVTKGAVSHWLNGRRQPSLQEIGAIFQYLGVSEVQFNHDGTFSTAGAPALRPVEQQYSYPLFTTVQAGKFSDVEPFTMEDAEEWVSTSCRAGEKSFWLKVTGHSMTAPQGIKPSFPEGMLILVDPYQDVEPGDYCVATADNDTEATFKKFTWDDGKAWLEPLNPNPRYQPILFDENLRVIGKVVHARWPDEAFR